MASFMSPPLATTTFDLLLGSLIPIALLLVGYRLRGQLFSWSDLRNLLLGAGSSSPTAPYYTLERAYHSYLQYLTLSYNDVRRMRNSYGSLGRAYKNIGYKIGYPQKLERVWEATSVNAILAEEIAALATREHPELESASKIEANAADLARVREALKHFVRDWSHAGSQERERTFAPILNLLRRVEPDLRSKMRILTPGSGLGRLAWEISKLGFDTTANELSYFMTLAFRFLLSPETTQQIDQHKLRPYAHWFSHQRSTENMLRNISFPDVVPRLGPNFHLIEQDFLRLPVPKSVNTPNDKFWTPGQGAKDSSSEGYEYIVTLFFIDTSFNVFATLEQIFKLLAPGGSWVNLGPLLWAGGGQSKLELSLEELLAAAEEVGFVLERHAEEEDHPEAQRTVECEYTADPSAMMRWTYKTEFWVAKKPR